MNFFFCKLIALVVHPVVYFYFRCFMQKEAQFLILGIPNLKIIITIIIRDSEKLLYINTDSCQGGWLFIALAFKKLHDEYYNTK